MPFHDDAILSNSRTAAQKAAKNLCAMWQAVSTIIAAEPAPPPPPIVPDTYDRTSIFNVCCYGDLPALRQLIANGLDIHANNGAALQWGDVSAQNSAVKYGHMELIHFLHEQGIDFHVANDSAFRVAAFNGQLKALKFLLEKGADIHANNDAALKCAAHNGYFEIVRFLTEHGADIHADNDQAIQWASREKHFKIVDYLLSQGANPEMINPDKISAYGDYKREKEKHTGAFKKNLAEIFNPKTWIGHNHEMVALWQKIPKDLQAEFDFSHAISEVNKQSLKLQHRKVTYK